MRVLYNLHEEAPDEIAAEEFKHSFILNTSDDSDDYLDHSILDQLERMPGCIIYTFGSQTMTSSSTRLDFKGIQDYYNNNKRKLGHVRTAMMYKGNMLLLISSEKVMKIEGLTCGKEATEDSIQVIQSILSNLGFIVPQGYLYDHESFVKTR